MKAEKLPEYMNKCYRLGIDIGSTTVKIAVLDSENHILFSDYRRHLANIQETLALLLTKAVNSLGPIDIYPVITGSGGLTLAEYLNVPFAQEVVAVAEALQTYAPKTDVAIELGGEDAKIIYFQDGNVEQRMNGICAGGTGSFIDQMASLLQTDAAGLNEYAGNYKALYSIAARCGVFAKTDIQPLINEGATKEDLAASIFQAVVNQTISGLACGKPIRGHVAFLGGPLHFLSELRQTFIRTLKLDEEHTIIPEHSHLFAASGSALLSRKETVMSAEDMIERLHNRIQIAFEVERLEPLFCDQKEFADFRARHAKAKIEKRDLASYEGNCYLGIDAGSTTTKIALVGEDGSLLYSFYHNNNGSTLHITLNALQDLFSKLPEKARIVRSCSTGYGEALIKAALMLDEGEVETISHYYAAQFFDPEVDCILDIGGQDMKCIRIKNHTVDNVQLNEACSSGCGSFIETFAKSLNLSIQDFAQEALFAENPIDLGTRCTVFMNSRVKQAQKEGAGVDDISAGLAYSVIKNALFKVIKVSDASSLGKHIVVQGGTFYNNAVLRSLEKIAECEVVRPDIAGIMGAFGAALIARERYEGQHTTMLTKEQMEALEYSTSMTKCHGCTNNCRLTINKFSGGRRYVSGNRCERGLGKEKKKNPAPNLFAYKNERLFSYKPLTGQEAVRGLVGIPRVLNMYENYPFWFTFFTELKYQVVLSPESTHELYEQGIESIPSESECYPAKLVHGHIKWLLQHNIPFIFYPCVPYERSEFKDANNHYNCPIVTSYAENIKNNMEELQSGRFNFCNPFLSFESLEILTGRLIEEFGGEKGMTASEITEAAKAAWEELRQARLDICKKGQETLKWMEETHTHGIVLAGRPYHIDKEINHGIPELINGYGLAVLTEDSISHLHEEERPLRVMDQWMYHSRLYAAAGYVKTRDDLDLIQLNSFGCGLDAVTTDQVSEILNGSGKIYTCLKIDEVSNLGAARIRIRSLLSAIRVREKKKEKRCVVSSSYKRIIFTEEMRKNYTILCPDLSPLHFDLLESAFRSCGFKIDVLPKAGRSAVDLGLKYVNNDACYPSIIVIGQIMEAVLSGKYDLSKTAVLISQTGGGCRASNYIGFVRKALEKAGHPDIPVISINLSGLEKNPGFKYTPEMLFKSIYALVFGDLFMKVLYHTRPYEMVKGVANKTYRRLNKRCKAFLMRKYPSWKEFKRLCNEIVEEFDHIQVSGQEKPKVGIVGEILVKFSPSANNGLAELLEAEGAEAVVPGLMDFLLYCFKNTEFKAQYLGKKKSSAFIGRLGIRVLEFFRAPANKALGKSIHFSQNSDIDHMANMAKEIVSLGNQTGEGWFLTAEMLELMEAGTPNIVCTQPFACLPNHIVGKGVIKELRRRHPKANIVAIDYDPGASEVNQLNRIKLMLSTAFKNAEKRKEA